MGFIHIDGSHGEGGGGILRLATALSTITQKPIIIEKIREGRCNPGMQEQHLQAVKAVARLCNAQTMGLEKGSRQLEFIPGMITKKQLKVEIKTAGSVGLVLQAVMLPCFFAQHPVSVRILGGGSFGKWAPNLCYFQGVLFPVLRKLGLEMQMEIVKHGMYPEGGADVLFKTKPCKRILPLRIEEQGKLHCIRGISIASEDLRKGRVAERQAEAAARVFGKKYLCKVKIESCYVSTPTPGSSIVCWAEFDHCILGWDALGEKGKYSEKVGEEAALGLQKQIESKATADEYLSDQVLPYLCFAAEDSAFKIAVMSGHLQTNMWLLKQFLDVDFRIDGGEIHVIKLMKR